ncbi:MAG: hypothetical protein KY476_20190 [Planctomycetes bacterium]|nr:hypothetical protein [Planctomycetota bacterium]
MSLSPAGRFLNKVLEMAADSHRDELSTRSTASQSQEKSIERTAADDFARLSQEKQPGLLAEFWDFLIHNKKWWLIPIVVVLLLMTILIVLAGTPAAPFLYP